MFARGERILTTAVAIAMGLFVLTDLFVSQWPANIFDQTGLRQAIGGISALFVGWLAIIIAFALFLGFFNVFGVHVNRIRTKKPGSLYSWVLLLSLVFTLGIGFLSGGPGSDGSQFIFVF